MRVAFHGMTDRQRLIPMPVHCLEIDYKIRRSYDGLQSLVVSNSTGRCYYPFAELDLFYPSKPPSLDICYMNPSTLNALSPYGLAELLTLAEFDSAVRCFFDSQIL